MNWKKIIGKIRGGLLTEEHVCPWWLAYTFDNPLRRILHDPYAMLAPYVRDGMTVADLGCGMGYFSVAMAEMVGENGSVIAVDIQQEMLDVLQKRAEKSGAAGKIRRVLAEKNDIGIREQVDFALAFWMVHETGNIPRFLEQAASILKHQGSLFIAEPRVHVSRSAFEKTLEYAREAGFTVMPGTKVRISRSAELVKK